MDAVHAARHRCGAELLMGEMLGGEYFAAVGVPAALGRTTGRRMIVSTRRK